MSVATSNVTISYFGKLPARGDFVKTPGSHQLVARLDQWAGDGIEQLSHDPGWKRMYDVASAMHFAMLGSRNPVAVAGHFIPSRDASDRRFPFLSAAQLDLQKPLQFMARGPLALSRLWTRLGRQGELIVHNDNPDEALRQLAETQVGVSVDAIAYEAPYQDFLEIETIGTLDNMLETAGHPSAARRILLALGLLLQPVMASGAARLEKGLSLPLPKPGPHQNLVATLWSDLLAGFLARADFELVMLIRPDAAPLFTVGFNGAHSRTLHSMLDPQVCEEHNIVLDDPEWVDEHVNEDYALQKLASYLEHEDLSLRMARDTFRETFLGG